MHGSCTLSVMPFAKVLIGLIAILLKDFISFARNNFPNAPANGIICA